MSCLHCQQIKAIHSPGKSPIVALLAFFVFRKPPKTSLSVPSSNLMDEATQICE